ncbi:GntR family transcriptional regulator [Trueperella pyogenes]|uniref:GntR family transcriptional regulator n=1 Tax=Trueperella pyogenes TaxID=1661 RepID=UPI00312B3EE3
MSTKLETISARRSTYNILREKIINMELPPSSLLSENELANELGCSRTPVREALILLADAGLVNVVPRKGTFVSSLNFDDIKDAQFLREAVELHALETISFPLDAKVLEKIDANLKRQRAAIDGGPFDFFVLDEEFHQLILELSGHRSLWQQVSVYKTHLDRARFLGLSTRDSLSRFQKEHVSIVDHLIDGNTLAAHQALRDHLRVVLDDLKIAARRYPAIFKLAEFAGIDQG